MPQAQRDPKFEATAVRGSTMAIHAKRFKQASKPSAESVAHLIAHLADRFAIRPSDVPDFELCQVPLKKAGVNPKNVSPALLAKAGGIWRAGIADSIRQVDEINEAVLKRIGDEDRVAENGEVQLVKKSPEPAAPRKPVEKTPRKPGLEILGMPATTFISAAGGAGFGFAAVRAALDELGGIGVKSHTIKHHLAEPADAELTKEQLAELEPFRDAAPPPPKERVPVVPVEWIPPEAPEVL